MPVNYTGRALARPPRRPVHNPAPPIDPLDNNIFKRAPTKDHNAPVTKYKKSSKPTPEVLHWTKDTFVNQQNASSLFRLPREVRELIWQYSLAQTEDSKPAHFHIYDLVYDSCTYGMRTEEDAYRRTNHTQMSLLLTCRAVYLEALRYLYENTDFVLILLAGRARPREYLDSLNSLGTIQHCATMFQRMRNINLVFQPGKRPNAEKYAARITELLNAFNNFARVTYLSLDFNFHRRFSLNADRDASFRTIIRALYPLGDKPDLPIVIQPCAFWPRPPTDSDLTFNELQAELKGSTMLPWSYSAWKENYSSCSQRGFDHARVSFFNPMYSWRQRMADTTPIAPAFALYVLLLPISAPLTYYYFRRRKFDKGEW